MDASRLQAEAETLGARLDAHQADQLLRYVGLLERWNARFNLISRRDIGRIWARHILDSLSIAPIIRDSVGAAGERPTAFDVGTGAGLPGLPLAIALPEVSWLLLDRNHRKIRFLETVIAELGLGNVTARVADLGSRTAPDLLSDLLNGADVVVSRAVDDPAGLLPLAEPLLNGAGVLVLMTATAAVEDQQQAEAGADVEQTPADEGKARSLPEGFVIREVRELRIPGLDRTHEVTIIDRRTRPQ